MPPPPAPKPKRHLWQWAVGGVGAVFVALLIIGSVAPKPATHIAKPAASSSARATTSSPAPTTTTTTTHTTAAAPTTTRAANTTAAAPAAPPVAAAAPPPAPAATGMSQQQISDITYIAVLDENHVRYASRDGAIETAHTICTALQAGNTVTAIGQTIVNTGQYSYQDAGTIVGAAESAYCPGNYPN